MIPDKLTKESLHRSVDHLFFGEENCPARRVRAFCNLLDDKAIFDGAEGDDAARLRMRVFALAATKHPLVVQPLGLLEHREADVSKALMHPWRE